MTNQMNRLRYTLVTDGSSDEVIIPILTWLLRDSGISIAIENQWAELRGFRRNQPRTLGQRIERALELYPCDLLFVHRDAEREPRKKRVCEISQAINQITVSQTVPPRVCVVPVRMQEAWLLIDENAIRRAAGNPNGKKDLELPQVSQLESLPDPKTILHDCLKKASGLGGRRLRSFPTRQKSRLVAEFMNDFSQLKELLAFMELRKDLKYIIDQEGWDSL